MSVVEDVQIKVLTAGEVEELVGWAALEGWNPGHGDAAAFRSADPDGFLGCFVDGVAAAVKQAESLIALGLTTAKRGAYATPVRKPYHGDLARFSPEAMGV